MWLLRRDTARELQARSMAMAAPTADAMTAHEQRVEASAQAARDGGPRSLTVAGDVAELAVSGILVQRPSFWLWLLGHAQTTYADLLAGIAAARSNPEIASVRVLVDSPGGEVDGLFETLGALELLRSEKDVSVRAVNAFSAAFAIAAVAGPIEAQNEASGFGSVGVAVSVVLDTRETVIDITNTESPAKRPDVETEEGRAVVRAHLDDLFDVFVDRIASGRGTTARDVTQNFGRGASLLASNAKRLGMIDSIAKTQLRMVRGASADAGGETPRASADGARQERENSMSEQQMDMRSLRTSHPELCEQLIAEGVTQERDRVCAHLTMGEASGAAEVAIGAIRDGSVMTMELNAKYLAAGMNRSATSARQVDSDSAGAATDGAKDEPEQVSAEDQLMETVVSTLEQRRGKAKA